ncbi:multicopper oxidase family protein [Micromonospora sp. NPDC047738]|uniref:multicopper oxidase family protein n=1 Tax=Micromonospora sp. NPDC047738 TaxID=3155741 RepID=UPI0033D46E59
MGGTVAGGLFVAQRAVANETSATAPTAAGRFAHQHVGPVPARAGVAPLTVAPFQVRMPIPPIAAPVRQSTTCDEYEVEVRRAQVEVVPGLTTDVLTYGGGLVGPTIRGRTGRPVKVTFRNSLDVPTNVHLHGGHVAAADDGHPMDLIQPGAARVYHYPNSQRGTTLWYHDHAHGLEAEHVYYGLHGFYLIDDPAEQQLRLPTGNHDVPIMLKDVKLDDTGALVYDIPAERTTVLANGKPTPFFPVSARKYRFRLLNASNEGMYTLSIDKGKLWQIGTDGGLLPAPVARPAVTFGSAERVDVVIDFTGLPSGSSVILRDADKGPVLRFDVGWTAPDTSRVPARLRALPMLPQATVERDVRMRFDFTGDPVGLINDKAYDPNRVDFTIKRGSTEIWTIHNDDTEFGLLHTFHMHLAQFRVLSRTGAPMTPDDAGDKDTVVVPAGTSVRVQATFDGYLGRYAYHCHFLEHSSIGMMAQMEIVP